MTGQTEEIGFISLIVKAVNGTVLALLNKEMLLEYQGLQTIILQYYFFCDHTIIFFNPSLCISLAVLLHIMFMGIREAEFYQ